MYPCRARTTHLAETLSEMLGAEAAAEASRRMAAAADSEHLETTLLWFDVWVALDTPPTRRPGA